MATPASLTHLFAELSHLEELGAPLKGSSRIRYTCMSVSRRYVALGSNTGCVYVFGRDSLKHLQSIYGDVDASAVTVVALSPNELNVGFAVSSGQVVVMETNIEKRSKPERLRQTVDHLGTIVTAMVWDSASTSLFAGDSAGKVTHINVPSSKAKTIFSQPSQIIVRLDSGVSQLDCWGGKLLASSLTRTYLLNTSKQQFSQIGKKPREGEFGACFFVEPSSKYPVIYCARPGSRMWEVDFEGNVLNTHQFKQLLAIQPLPIISAGLDFEDALQADQPGPQSVNFLQMFSIGEFILTWSNRGLYIFDPINVKVVLWTDTLKGIKDVCIIKNEVYVLLDSQKIRRLLFLPVLHLCAALVSRRRCSLAADLLLFIEHFALKPTVLKHVKKELLPQLIGHLRETGHEDKVEKVQALLEDVSESSMDSVIFQEDLGDANLHPLYTTQLSGIVVVNDGAVAYGDAERRWSPHSFSPVSFFDSGLESPHSGPRRSGPQSAGSMTDVRSTAYSNYTEMRKTSEPLSVFDSSANQSTDERLLEISCESECSELQISDVQESSGRMSRSVVDSQKEGRVDMYVPVELEQNIETSPGTEELTLASVNDDPARKTDIVDSDEVFSVQTSNNASSSSVMQGTEEGLDESIRTKTLEDSIEADPKELSISLSEVQPQEVGMLRKINSLPEIVVEECVATIPSETSIKTDERVEPVLSPVRRASSGSTIEVVSKSVKKKKRRKVNEVEFPVAGSSSGQMKRSLSTGMLKQKQKREALQKQRSLDSSPISGLEDDLYQPTDPDPECVSIGTISSIEEEDSVIDSPVSVMSASEHGDVFVDAVDTQRSSSCSQPSDASKQSLRDVESGSEAKHLEDVDLNEDESESAVPLQSFPEEASVFLETADKERLGSTTDLVEGDSELPGSENSHLPESVRVCSSVDEDAHSELSLSLEDKLSPSMAASESEVIPPLIERLSALGVAPGPVEFEDGGGNVHDLSSVKNLLTEASKQKIASVKERVTKFSTTTKSLIRRVKEKNRLVSRSPSESPPFTGSPSTLSSSPLSKDEVDMGNILSPDEVQSACDSGDFSISSSISTDQLCRLSESTQKLLKDPAIVLDQEKLREILNTWTTELNQTLMAYHVEVFRQQLVKRKMEADTDSKDGSLSLKEEAEKQRNFVKEKESVSLKSDVTSFKDYGSSVDPENNENTTDTDLSEEKSKEESIIGEYSHDKDSKSVEKLTKNGTCNENSKGDENENSVKCNGNAPHLDSDTQLLPEAGSSVVGSSPVDADEFATEQKITEKFTEKFASSVNGSVDGACDSLQNRTEVLGESETCKESETVLDSELDLRIDWSQICHVKDPFKLPPQQHTMVSTLASHCLDCGCFGNAFAIFSLRGLGPRKISAKDQVLESVPSSFKSFSDADSSLPSPAEKLVHQKLPSQNSMPPPSCNSNTECSDCQLSCATNAIHCSKSSELSTGTKCTCQVSAEDMPYSDLKDDKSTAQCQDSEIHNQVVKAGVVGEEVNDQERALFIQLYYHLLPHWRLRRIVAETDGKDVFATWHAVIVCCQALGHGDIVWMKIQNKDVTGALDYLRSGILPNKLAFLGHIASLFELSAMKVTDFVSELPRQVKMWDLLHLCRLHSKPVLQVISRYLTQRLGATPSSGRLEIVKQLCQGRGAKLAILECLLHLLSSSLSSSSSCTVTSNMRLKSNVDNTKLSYDAISEMLTCVFSLLKETEMAEALNACWKHKYWPGCLRLLRQTDQWQKALQLEVKLDDLSLLNGQKVYGYAPRNVEQWKYLFWLYKQVSSSEHSSMHPSFDADSLPLTTTASLHNTSQSSPASKGKHSEVLADGRTGTDPMKLEPGSSESERSTANVWESDMGSRQHLTWLSLGMLAAEHVGASTAVELLQSCCDDDGAAGGVLNAEFYRTSMVLSALEHRQKLVVHNMLEKVDSYLWAKKPVHLTPQFHYAVAQEKSAVQSRNADDHYYHSLFEYLSAAPVVENQLAEDPDCHWGVKANILRICEVCQVQVTETVSHLEPGVFAFKCGHVFHKFCVPDKDCPLCC